MCGHFCTSSTTATSSPKTALTEAVLYALAQTARTLPSMCRSELSPATNTPAKCSAKSPRTTRKSSFSKAVAADWETGTSAPRRTRLRGRGGLGNAEFKTATNQAPKFSQPGEPGIEKTVILELKVLADVGLVGFPNAGKSTLLSVVSAAKPEIADYPFTTLVPNLGIVAYHDYKSFVMADIPGIIEGASQGKGLGLRFLRHIERNSILLFMVPADTKDIRNEYEVLLNELTQYNPELLDKKRILAVTKCDLIDDELQEMLSKELPEKIETVFISSVAHKNIDKLKDLIWKALNE